MENLRKLFRIDSSDIYNDCYVNPTAESNIQNSTNAFNGYSCTAPQAIRTYLARSDVRNMLHITNGTGDFVVCTSYPVQSQDLTNDLLGILNSSNYTAVNGSVS